MNQRYREEQYYNGPTQHTRQQSQHLPPSNVQRLKRSSTGNMKAVQKPAVRVRREAPDRYIATVHTPALTIDGEWAHSDANMVSAIIDDAHEELMLTTMETYDLTHARIVSFEHDILTVTYLKQGWFRVKRFPVQHLFITMLIEDLSP